MLDRRSREIFPERIYNCEPDIEAIKFYLNSKRTRHMPGISHSKRNSIRVASENYRMENGMLMYLRPSGGEPLVYIEDKEQRQTLLSKLHK